MIKLNGVCKTYDKTEHLALSDIDICISKGEFVFIVGKSGAGKSTFMKLILKELEPSTGEIHVDDQDITKIKRRHIPFYRRKLGIVFQDFRLLSDKTVYENIAFAMEIVETSTAVIKESVPNALKLVGLSHRAHYFPDQLSGGEQQRVAIARAIINNPYLIICDEPTGNLDPKTSIGIMNLLKDINAKGTTVIMATHDKDIVDLMQMRVIALHGGKIVSDKKGGYHSED
ncbi:cell division ATP-binding protein FtsE [Alkalibaculum sp. M08DMB]|uniref:Cell division ATP-binding protein FtsE n=1 Tax=Alkalibaculum sporogenes TaxID=2655001 RepID=A0A6A7K959_9FIRM|nr:cell division ATP-binding protein FtsE [Alkalibaculum sporogenes]MPW25895.1 cell division ATP-binding protein FtsE [Alkalibaculum sporogenes]